MNRKVLIISNPGEKNAENYCEGVNKDVENYLHFFHSTYGGAWFEDEIITLNRPTVRTLERALIDVNAADYSIVIFTGHGYMNGTDTIIELKNGEEYDARDLAKNNRTLILDCCRKRTIGVVMEEAAKTGRIFMEQDMDLWDCREYYEAQIAKCEGQRLVLYSCDEGEVSNDDGRRGGYYSYYLLKTAKDWYKNNKNAFDPMVLSMVQAHNEAGRILRYRIENQTPQIEKPREAPYYPFAVII